MSNLNSPQSANLLAAFAVACEFARPLTVRAVNRVTGAETASPVDRPFAFLGRVKGLGVHLDDPSVSQCHAYIQVVQGVPHVFDLGSRTGVLWDDGGRGAGPVFAGQTLRIGSFDVRVEGGAEAEVPFAQEAAHQPSLSVLEVHSPTGENGYFSLDRPVTLIGRHPTCHLRFLEQEISYFQCALVVTLQGVWFLDMPNRKGTPLNGRTPRLARLRDGDLLELGKVSLVFRDGEPTGQPLVPALPHAALNVTAVRPGSAEVVAAALGPLREMMEQFQQSFVTMARMFTVMQQEHTAMMCEQMRQLQEIMRESREGSKPNASGNASPPPAPAPVTSLPPPTATPRPPTPKASQGPEADALLDAHNWFIDRMAKKSQPPGPKPG